MSRNFRDRSDEHVFLSRIEMWSTFDGYMELSSAGVPAANKRGIEILRKKIGFGVASLLFGTEGIEFPEGRPGGPRPPQLGGETWLAQLSAMTAGRPRTVSGPDVVEKSRLAVGWFQHPEHDPFTNLADHLKTISWVEHAEDASYEF